jgi:hypothetical protein
MQKFLTTSFLVSAILIKFLQGMDSDYGCESPPLQKKVCQLVPNSKESQRLILAGYASHPQFLKNPIDNKTKERWKQWIIEKKNQFEERQEEFRKNGRCIESLKNTIDNLSILSLEGSEKDFLNPLLTAGVALKDIAAVLDRDSILSDTAMIHQI